jgi:hypothetical protein
MSFFLPRSIRFPYPLSLSVAIAQPFYGGRTMLAGKTSFNDKGEQKKGENVQIFCFFLPPCLLPSSSARSIVKILNFVKTRDISRLYI